MAITGLAVLTAHSRSSFIMRGSLTVVLLFGFISYLPVPFFPMVFTPCIMYNTLNVIDEDKYPNLFHRILKKRFPRMSFRGIVDEIRHQGRQTSDLDFLTSRAFEREARASESS